MINNLISVNIRPAKHVHLRKNLKEGVICKDIFGCLLYSMVGYTTDVMV